MVESDWKGFAFRVDGFTGYIERHICVFFKVMWWIGMLDHSSCPMYSMQVIVWYCKLVVCEYLTFSRVALKGGYSG